jgi:hypothetical protein
MATYGVIVVHGVGEQRRFEFLESIACNLFRALRNDAQRSGKAYIQLRRGDQVPHLSEEESWHEAPALIRWQTDKGGDIEVRFREVHWADLDFQFSWRRWLGLVVWSLGVSGVRLFDKSAVGKPGKHGMCPPKGLSVGQRALVRMQLFGVSLLFFLMLVTSDLAYGLLSRFGFRLKYLRKFRGLIYNYLGDVKLYQDAWVRDDDRLEVIGEKSRVAIRRRMVRALVQTAAEVERGELDGYYVFSHSLGTVVAFNGLMETALALPNYLTEAEWNALPALLKTKSANPAPAVQMPRRPLWLGDTDAVDRARLFKGLRGVLTMGSPLDKFAALWPAIVPVNGEPIPGMRPWINVADVQDIVAGSIDLFPACGSAPGVGGLKLVNHDWADQKTLFTAHTSYWQAKKGKSRLIDRLIPWIEGHALVPPDNSMPAWLGRLIYGATLAGLGILLLWLVAWASHHLLAWASHYLPAWISDHLPAWLGTIPVGCLMWDWLGVAVIVVLVMSVWRRIYEGRG